MDFVNQRKTIVRLALEAHLPTMFLQRQDVEAGGFMSYGVNETEGAQRAAAYVDKILKGQNRVICRSNFRPRSRW